MGIFEPNPIFSVARPSFRPTDHATLNRVVAVTRRFYAGVHPEAVRQVRGLEVNSSNWRLDCGRDRFVLKRIAIGELQSLRAQLQWCEQVGRRAVPIPEVVPSRRGELVAVDRSEAFLLTRFEPGAYFGADPRRWQSVVVALGRLLQAARVVVPKARVAAIPRRIGFGPNEQRIARALLSNRSNRLTSGRMDLLLGIWDRLRAEPEAASPADASVVMHIDLHPRNLLFRGPRLAAVVDIQSFQRANLEACAGFCIYKFLRELLVGAGGSGELDRRVRRYRRVVERELPQIPWERLLLGGERELVKRALYVLREVVLLGETAWVSTLATQLDGLEELGRIREA